MSAQGITPWSLAKGAGTGRSAQPGALASAPVKKGRPDAFDRNIAHTLSTDRFKRQLDIAYHQLEEAKGKLEVMLVSGVLPNVEEMNKEISSRLESVAKSNELAEACQKLLDQWEDRKYAQKEKAQEHRKRIQETVGNLVPEVQGMLAKIEHRIELETNRLYLDNLGLKEENSELRKATSESVGAQQLTTQLEKFLDGKLELVAQQPPPPDTKKIDRLERLNRQLESEKKDLEIERRTETTRLENELKQEQLRSKDLEEKRDSAVQTLKQASEEARKQKETGEELIRLKETELRKAQRTLKEAQSKVAASDDLQAEVLDLTNQIERKQTVIEALEKLVAKAVDPSEFTKAQESLNLKADLETHKTKLEKLRTKYRILKSSLQDESDTLESTKAQVAQLESGIAEVRADNVVKDEAIALLEDEIVQLEGLVTGAESLRAAAEGQRDQYAKTIQILQEAKDNAIAESSRLRTSKRDFVALWSRDQKEWKLEMREIEAENETLRGEKLNLETENQQLTNEKQNFVATIERIGREKINLVVEREDYRMQVSRLTSDIEDRDRAKSWAESEVNWHTEMKIFFLESDKTHLKREKQYLEAKVSRLEPVERQVFELRNEADDLRTIQRDQEDKIRTLEDEKEALVRKLEREQKDTRTLETKKAVLDYQVGLHQDDTNKIEQLQRKAGQVDLLLSEKKNLESRLSRVSFEANKVTSLASENSRLIDQISRLQPEADKVKLFQSKLEELQSEATKVERLTREKAILEGEKVQLEKDKKEQGEKLDLKVAEVRDLQNTNKVLEDEVVPLRLLPDQVRSLTEDKRILETNNRNLDSDNKQLEVDKTQLESDKKNLESEKIRLETEKKYAIEAHEKSFKEASDLRPSAQKVPDLESEVNQLREQIAALQTTADKVPILEIEKSGLETANSGLETAQIELRTELATTRDELRSSREQVTELSNSKGDLIREKLELQNWKLYLIPFQNSSHKFEKEVEQLRKTNKSADEQIKTLIEEKAALQIVANKVTGLEEECTRLQKMEPDVYEHYNKELERLLRKKDDTLKSVRKEASEAQSKVHSLQTSKDDLQKELNTANDDFRRLQNEKSQVDEDLKSLKIDLEEYKNNEESSNEGKIEKMLLSGQYTQLQRKYDATKEDVKNLEKRIAEMISLETHEQTLANLDSEMEGMVSRDLLTEAEDKSTRLEAEKAEMVSRDEHTKAIDAVKLQMEDMVSKDSLTELQNRLEAVELEKSNMVPRNELDEALKRIQELNAQLSLRPNPASPPVPAVQNRPPMVPLAPQMSRRISGTSQASPSTASTPRTPSFHGRIPGPETPYVSPYGAPASQQRSTPMQMGPPLPQLSRRSSTGSVTSETSDSSGTGLLSPSPAGQMGPPRGLSMASRPIAATQQLGYQQAGSPQYPGFQQPGFQQQQVYLLPPLGQPQIGHSHPQPALPYNFLVSGPLASGQISQNVSRELVVKMNAQISEWQIKSTGKGPWNGASSASAARCIDTRRNGIPKAINPPSAQGPNGVFACQRCISRNILCVLIGERGPVIVPLPLSERSANATPTSGDYFVKS